MQDLPKKIKDWSEIDWSTGNRNLKNNAPDDVVKLAVEYEKEFYKKTSRRMIDNVNID